MAFLLRACLSSPLLNAADTPYDKWAIQRRLPAVPELLCGQHFSDLDERARECTVRVIQERPVRMVTSSDPGIFPKSWRSEPMNGQAKALRLDDLARPSYILNNAMGKYPSYFLKQNLQVIYLLQSLEVHGVNIGGIAVGRIVYVATQGYPDASVELTFHHEFSHTLLRNFRSSFDRESWESANPSSFKYGKGGSEFIKENGPGNLFDASLHEEGFLSKYSTSRLEEDFASIAMHLFDGNVRFWKIVSQYQRIKEKTDLVIAFYHNIDSDFDESFFVSIAKGSSSEQNVPADSTLKR